MNINFDKEKFEVRPSEKDLIILATIKSLMDIEIEKGNVPAHFYKYRNQISYSRILRIILEDFSKRPDKVERLFKIKGYTQQKKKVQEEFEKWKSEQ